MTAITYNRVNWVDYPSQNTPIDAALLNQMDAGIAAITADPGSGLAYIGTGAGLTAAFPPGHEFGYDQITAPVNVVSTTESSGTSIITCAAHVFDGAPVIARFNSPAVLAPAASSGFLIINLFEGSTQIGRLATVFNLLSTAQIQVAVSQDYRFTPSAGSHTYTVTAYVSATTGTPSVGAGAAGTTSYIPASIRFTKV